MATIDIRRSHDFSLEKAKEAAVAIAKQLDERIGISYRWEGDDLALKRTGATGRLEVREREVRVLIELGLALRPLKGHVTKRVHDYLDEHFPS